MSIRKFRKNMKPFIFILTIVFLLSLVVGGYQSFKTSRVNKKAQEAFKINGDYVQKVEVERAKNDLYESYLKIVDKTQVDKNIIDILAFNNVIEKKLTLDLAKKLKIKVSSSEVEEHFKAAEQAIGDKDQFKRMLQYQGLTKEAFKDKIESDLLLNKTYQYFVDEQKVDEKEIYDSYLINDNNVDLVKDQIISDLKKIKGLEAYQEALAELKSSMKLEEVAQEYQKLVETEAYKEEGFVITNLDLAKLELIRIGKDKVNLDEAEKLVKESISKEIKIATIAKEKGVTVDSKLDTLTQLSKYKEGLIEKIRTEIKPSEEELLKFFNENKSRYEKRPFADVNLAIVSIKPSKEDEEVAKKKAEDILAKVTKENFEKEGKELSENKEYIYEDLGTFSKGMMVKEFEDAVKNTPTDSIHNKVVKTGYGYHIVYVKENDSKNSRWTVSHIMVKVIPSDKTVSEKLSKVEKIVNDLNSGTISFSEITKLDSDIVQTTVLKGITPDGNIPNMAYNPEITKEIFDTELNKAGIYKNSLGIMIFQKIKEGKYEAPNFEKSKEQVKNNYINNKTLEYMANLF